MGALGSLELDISEEIRTQHTCYMCDETLCLTDEAVLLQVVYPYCPNGHVETCAVDDGSGNYLYAPRFLHMECWEEVEEELLNFLEDVPPIVDPYTICECSFCKSDIRAWESTGLLTFGELRQSRRRPNGEPTIHFDECGLGAPKVMCAACIMTVSEETAELWEGFSHNGECQEGTHRRCWRTGECREVCQEKLENT